MSKDVPIFIIENGRKELFGRHIEIRKTGVVRLSITMHVL